MFLKVFPVIYWITVFYVQPSKQQMNTKQAISSQSFIREDVPKSYRYTAIHDYTTVKPELQTKGPNLYHLKSKWNLEGIQYEPLVNENAKYDLHTRTPYFDVGTTEYTPTIEASKTPIRKDHLEPKPHVQNLASFIHVPYIIPRHNVEILQSVNRSPGHNAFYRNYPQNIPNVPSYPQNQINYHRAFKIYKVPEIHTATELHKNPQVDLKSPAVNHETKPYKYYVDYKNEGKQPKNAIENGPSRAHPQTHNVLLNLARIYNNAKLPCKNSSNAEQQDCSIQNNSLLFKHLQRTDDRTHLYPIAQKHQIVY